MERGGGVSAPTDTVDATATELERYHPPEASLFRTDDPVEVVEKATRVANALKHVVTSRGLVVRLKGREHPRVEAWQTLGSMLGVFAVPLSVRPLAWPDVMPESLRRQREKGLAFGFEASFVAQRPDGSVVGGGDASCVRTEANWADRDDFMLKSMAQTRATSKALKAPLGFVMVLAGYEATPAEEMGYTPGDQPAAPATPPAAAAPSGRRVSAEPARPTEATVTPAQRRKINAQAAEKQLTPLALLNILRAAWGKEPADLPHDRALAAVNRLLDRLPRRLVDPVLAGINSTGPPEDAGV